MKIAVASNGNSRDSKLDSRFGRCSYFAVYNTENNKTHFVPNPHKDDMEGAGQASVQMLASLGVKKVVSAEFGVKVKSILDSLEIKMAILKDTAMSIDEVIDFLNNKK